MAAQAAIKEKVIVVGAGNAAGYFCKRIVDAVENGEAEMPDLTVIGEEFVAPYERPALTKSVLHPDNPSRLPDFHTTAGCGGTLQTPDWYAEHGIKLYTGESVVAADFEAGTLQTSPLMPGAHARTLEYDKLVVASGVRARTLPAELGGSLPGVHYIRSEKDALYLAESLPKTKKVVVVGGGYIGMEVAAAISAWDIPVVMLFFESHIMPRLFNKEIAQHYEALYRENGVEIMTNTSMWYVDSGVGMDVNSVVLTDPVKVVPADLVVIGMGIDIGGGALGPFRKFTDIKVAGDEGVDPMELATLQDNFSGVGGIKVNGTFRVDSPFAKGKVWAIGDVCAFPLKIDNDELTRVEHVDHARRSAAVAAEDILGLNPPEYDYIPFFYSRIFNHEGSTRVVNWKFYGLQKGEIHVVGDFDPKLAGFWVHEGKCFGIMLESGSDEEIALIQVAARNQPSISVEDIKKAKTVEEALNVVAVALDAPVAA